MITRTLTFCLFVIIATVTSLIAAPHLLDAKPVEEGMNVSEVSFTTPASQDARSYLGLKDGTSFAVSDIPATLVLVEIFHVLCQYCQKQAPEVNRIYQFIEQNPDLNKDIKVFSVAIQSEQKSLDAFKKTFRVKFPIVPDLKLKAFTALGDPHIPFLMLVDKQGKILLTHSGYLKDGDDFFRKIKDLYSKQAVACE